VYSRQKVLIPAVIGLTLCFSFALSAPSAETTAKTDKKYTFNADWFSHNIPIWSRVLRDMKGKPNLNYLEVGTFEGRSFFWVLDNILTHPSSVAVGIDTFEKSGGNDPEAVFRENVRRSGRSSKVKVIKGFSQQKMRDLKLNSFDLIYIDGDHASKSVLMDAVLAWDLLKDGGILIFDDYKWDYALPAEMRPAFALDVFQTLFRENFRILEKGYQLIVRKTDSPCIKAKGSIKVEEKSLACTGLGPYTYYWKPKKLYGTSTNREITLSDGEISLIENVLINRKPGFRLEVKKNETDPYRNLLDRLGLNEISLSPSEK